MTICKKCIQYRHVIVNEAAPQVWYNHRCAEKSIETPESFDFVIGETIPAEKAYCRDANRDGDCNFYEEKPE